mgnify:CR=1 FL=1
MGLFKKKDPIVEVEKALDHEVHEMEHDIQADVDAVMKKYDRESNTRICEGVHAKIIRWIIVAISVYCIWSTLFSIAALEKRLTAFIALILVAGYLTYPASKHHVRTNYIPWYDFVLMIVGAACFVFYYFKYDGMARILMNQYKLPVIYIVVGIVLFAFHLLFDCMDFCLETMLYLVKYVSCIYDIDVEIGRAQVLQ